MSYICWIDGFFSFFHLLSTCAMLLSTFSILSTPHGLSGIPGNLELRNVERRGMARLAFDNVGLTGLVRDIDGGYTRDAPKNRALFAQAIFGEVSDET